MSDVLTIEQRGVTHLLTLHRPDNGNALSDALVAALDAALDAIEALQARVLVLRGAGRHFCTGFDLSDLPATSDADLLLRFVRIELLLARIWAAPYVTIAVVNGRAIGAGADLAAACSRRIALQGSSFAFPGAAFGLVLGTRRLAARIGDATAQHVVTSGVALDAAQALDLGLATATIGADALPDLLDQEIAAATRLDPQTVTALRDATRTDTHDADLAALVRSAARPGIGARITAYRAASPSSPKDRQ